MEHFRKKLFLIPGELVSFEEKHFRISEVLDFDTVIAIDVDSGKKMPLSVRRLKAVEGLTEFKDIDTISDPDWKKAVYRYSIIKPLLKNNGSGRKDVEERAKENGINAATLYRWLKRYRATGTLDGLMPDKTGPIKGSSRIGFFAEQIIQDVIQSVYLTEQRSSPQKVVQEVRRLCLEKKLPDIPHPNTIRNRVAEVSQRVRLRRRGHKEKAKNKFMPASGHFPHADYPLAVIQIDHTPVDLILVDDLYRMPIGRPYITLAIDVYSRMVTGYYLSFDPPSETSVAMCVAHSVLPKESWLTLHGVEANWPVWGIMNKIHVDNGPEFRSENFRKSCEMHSINLEYRPVKIPRYGGHIERLLGTFSKEIHDLPGTTFSSIKDRAEYDSEKKSALTKSEFEKWLVTLICKVYHKRIHRSLGLTPERAFEIGVFGNRDVEGRGVPPRPSNGGTLLLDFLPSYKRTIQSFGVTIEGLSYYDNVLRGWINALDPDAPKKKRQFIFRSDPRDISVIHFFDPDLKEYFRIPFANQAMPSMSIWEYREAKKRLRKEGAKGVNELEVLRAIQDMRNIVGESAKKTKRARMKRQRRKENIKQVTPVAPLDSKRAFEAPKPLEGLDVLGMLSDDIDPLEDIS